MTRPQTQDAVQRVSLRSRHWPASTPGVDAQACSYAEVLHLLKCDGHPATHDERVFRRRRIRAHQALYRVGQPFEGLYLVRMGALKSMVTDANGDEHVLSFAMRGDVLGMEGFDAGHYGTEVLALTDAEVIRLPAKTLFSQGTLMSELEHQLLLAISREMAKEELSYTLSQAVRSDVRVARFLQHQSRCFAELGYSPKRFTLYMTRRDVGNYLSVTLETVSRALSHLQEMGIIHVHNRDVDILDFEALSHYTGEAST
jgi:CRP/FNR family transcriptional regulator